MKRQVAQIMYISNLNNVTITSHQDTPCFTSRCRSYILQQKIR